MKTMPRSQTKYLVFYRKRSFTKMVGSQLNETMPCLENKPPFFIAGEMAELISKKESKFAVIPAKAGIQISRAKSVTEGENASMTTLEQGTDNE